VHHSDAPILLIPQFASEDRIVPIGLPSSVLTAKSREAQFGPGRLDPFMVSTASVWASTGRSPRLVPAAGMAE
jgi:hypothetical protein